MGRLDGVPESEDGSTETGVATTGTGRATTFLGLGGTRGFGGTTGAETVCERTGVTVIGVRGVGVGTGTSFATTTALHLRQTFVGILLPVPRQYPTPF